MLDIRPPGETDREAIALLSGLAFNSPAAAGKDFPGWPALRLRRGPPYRLGAVDRLRPVVRRCPRALRRYRRSRRPAGGPRAWDGRRAGEPSCSKGARAEGRLVSALYPSTATLYRKLGYEFGGFRPHFRVAITDLPAAGLPTSDHEKPRSASWQPASGELGQ